MKFQKGHVYFGKVNRPRDTKGRFIYEGGPKQMIKDKKCKLCKNLTQRRCTYCRSCAGSLNSPKLKGKDSPSWKGGIYPKNMSIRRSFEYKRWAKRVKERDNYTCQICGKKNVYLHSDHIMSFSKYPLLRFSINNGRTLCVSCHKLTPNYGAKLRWKGGDAHELQIV